MLLDAELVWFGLIWGLERCTVAKMLHIQFSFSLPRGQQSKLWKRRSNHERSIQGKCTVEQNAKACAAQSGLAHGHMDGWFLVCKLEVPQDMSRQCNITIRFIRCARCQSRAVGLKWVMSAHDSTGWVSCVKQHVSNIRNTGMMHDGWLNYSQIDNESAGCRDAMIAMGENLWFNSQHRGLLRRWRLGRRHRVHWSLEGRQGMYKIMAEGVVNSSKKIDDGRCSFSFFIVGQLLDQSIWVVCTSFKAPKDFFSGGRSSVVDFWFPCCRSGHGGPEPKSRLGPVLELGSKSEP